MVFSKEKLEGIKFHKETFLECVFVMIIILMGVYRLDELTMPIILDDEFGYWSNSMLFSGQDWTNLTSKINYYSYGYSLILCIVKEVAAFRGYGWTDLYQVAAMFNVIFVAAGYLLSVRIATRYLKNINYIMILAVCFVAAIYPSNMVYTHVTLAESTLTFCFWVFAYIMMRVIDTPSILNHIGLAFITIFLYAIHQRTLGLIITAVIIVILLRLLKINKFIHITVFLASFYGFYTLHSIIKFYVKNVNYMGNPSPSIAELADTALSKTMLVLFVAVLAVIIWLYALEKGNWKLSLLFIGSTVVVIGGAGLWLMNTGTGNSSEMRLSVNELSGQIGVLKQVFTKYGLIRLGTSIVGKWYYLAAATGFVICWGLRDLFLNTFWMTADGCKRFYHMVRGKEHTVHERLNHDFKAHIFLLGMFLAFASAFMICALYKEGLYKVDDLINGRYIEYLIGFTLIYSIDRLSADKHWIWFWLLFLGAYLAAGTYCQYVYEQLQRTEYELIHAVVFGRVFWNYEVPVGKIKQVAQYVIPLATGFILIFKAGFTKWKDIGAVAVCRLLLALILPVIAWNHIYTEIVDNYVVVRNQKQSGAVPQIAEWIKRLSNDEPVYFIAEGLSYRQAELLQYICGDIKLVLTDFGSVDFTKDALFILNIKYLDDDIINETCEVIDTKGSYMLVVNKHQSLMERWQWYAERMKPQPIEYIDEN